MGWGVGGLLVTTVTDRWRGHERRRTSATPVRGSGGWRRRGHRPGPESGSRGPEQSLKEQLSSLHRLRCPGNVTVTVSTRAEGPRGGESGNREEGGGKGSVETRTRGVDDGAAGSRKEERTPSRGSAAVVVVIYVVKEPSVEDHPSGLTGKRFYAISPLLD